GEVVASGGRIFGVAISALDAELSFKAAHDGNDLLWRCVLGQHFEVHGRRYGPACLSCGRRLSACGWGWFLGEDGGGERQNEQQAEGKMHRKQSLMEQRGDVCL